MSISEISFELTNACNLQCLHCLRQTIDSGHFPVDLFEKIIVQAKVFETPHIILTGGEPTLHPHLKEIIDIIVDSDYTYNIVTNGWRFERVLEILNGRIKRKKNLTGISLSIDGATEETHDKIRGTGSFRELMKTVSILRANHIRFAFLITVNRLNVHELEDVAKLSMSVGASYLFYSHMVPTQKTARTDMDLTPEEYRMVEAKVEEIKNFTKHDVLMSMGAYTPLKMFQCRTLTMSNLNFDYKGRLTFCCLLSGYREDPSVPETEIIADMRETELLDGVQLWMERIFEFNKDKLEYIRSGRWTEHDYFPCFYCKKYFGKINWLERFPDHPWARDIVSKRVKIKT